MSIKFACACGKRLKAADDMARKRIVCPGCGQLVGVPSLEPTVAGGAAPMSPQERMRLGRDKPALALDEAIEQLRSELPKKEPASKRGRVSLLAGKDKRRPPSRALEKHWRECLLYPLFAWRLCLVLALVLTVLSVGLAMILPHVLSSQEEADPWAAAATHAAWMLPALFLAGLPCTFLDRVLASAAGGEVDYILWSGNFVTTFLIAGARWLLCFLAGPGWLAAVGWMYWVKSGETTWTDLLILGELGVVGVAYFVFALVAVADRGRLRDMNPLAVADLAHRLRWRALAVVAASVVFLALGLLILGGITEVHRGTLKGWLMLTGGWFGGVFIGTFYARLLGVWVCRTRETAT